MSKRVLVTGGAGFIGHHFIEHILKNTDWSVVSLDRLDASGNLNRLSDMRIWEQERRRVRIVFHDLRAEINSQVAEMIGEPDMIFHLAAGTHVDRSIDDPLSFVLDNVVGTTNILNFARRRQSLEKFFYFSTDEVFGPAPHGAAYREWDRYNSGNPYAASKAGGEEMALAFHNTYKVPVVVTHTMNVFGERQNPEKFIPSTIRKVRDGKLVTIHADKTRTKSGSRFYIHARNVSAALMFLVQRGDVGEKYNIVGEREVSNLDLAYKIAEMMGRKLNYEMVDFHSSRPGHDLRYALDGRLMKEIGWEPRVDFDNSLHATVSWSLQNENWLKG